MNNRTILQATTSKTSSRDGLFDSTVHLEMEDIPDVAVQFECQLSIPGTEYLVSQKIFYDPSERIYYFIAQSKKKNCRTAFCC